MAADGHKLSNADRMPFARSRKQRPDREPQNEPRLRKRSEKPARRPHVLSVRGIEGSP